MPGRIGKKKVGNDKGLPVIKCSVCGEEIMLIPNVKLMSAAIEAHVETHKQKVKDPQSRRSRSGTNTRRLNYSSLRESK